MSYNPINAGVKAEEGGSYLTRCVKKMRRE
ncbi:hypothetical protein SAMN04489759_10350 [Sulfitobacter delicatus]|uniref:Uncharacterized protein n=1 Tax=Sulfitobacter delicatus TaxID=218672 RepID=A0A1G7NKP0_9RHOB|nr:hypothetical protein SAMN04489759_10350 [Sulfitobacter delicatus]